MQQLIWHEVMNTHQDEVVRKCATRRNRKPYGGDAGYDGIVGHGNRRLRRARRQGR